MKAKLRRWNCEGNTEEVFSRRLRRQNFIFARRQCHQLRKLQSWTKVLRQFTKTNAFELTTAFCIWMKTPFSSVVTPLPPPPPKQCCNTLPGCLFVSNIE